MIKLLPLLFLAGLITMACSSSSENGAAPEEKKSFYHEKHDPIDLDKVSRIEYFTEKNWNGDWMERAPLYSIKNDVTEAKFIKEIENSFNPKKMNTKGWNIISIVGRGPDYTFKTDGNHIVLEGESQVYELEKGDLINRYFK